MNTLKILVLLVLICSIPNAYTRHASLWSQKYFPRRINAGSHQSHESQDVPNFNNQVKIQDNYNELIVVAIGENKVNTPNETYEVIDINGNVGDSNNYYETQRDDQDIVASFEKDYPEIHVVDIQNVTADEVERPDDNEISVIYRNNDPDVITVKRSSNEVKTERYTSEIKPDAKNIMPETPPVVSDPKINFDPAYKVCDTVGCKELAKEFRRGLNTSVDPCENFYEFSCGGLEPTEIPPYLSTWSRNTLIEESFKRHIKGILESKLEPSDVLPVRQAKEWYRSCMNLEKLEQRGVKTIQLITSYFGGWPMAMNDGEWDKNENSWQIVELEYAYLTGSYVFYDINVENPSKGDSVGAITIDAPKLPLASQFPPWLENYIIGDYEKYRVLVSRIARVFAEQNGASVSNERLLKESRGLVAFERALSRLKRIDSSRTYYGSYGTVEKLNDRFNFSSKSAINWSTVIKNLFKIVKVKLHPSSKVWVKDAWVNGIGKILQTTSPRTIVNYIHWHFVVRAIQFTTEKMRDELFQHVLKNTFGLKERKPRWLECVDEIQMEHAVSYAFVKKYFTRETESAVQKIIENTRMALEQNIDNSNWLEPEAMALAKEKLKSMKTFVGFPDWYYNRTAFVNYYKGLTIGTDYLDNNLRFMMFKRKQQLGQYATSEPQMDPFNGDRDSPIVLNAFYLYSGNFAQFAAVNFQPPYFEVELPNNVNYGIIGFIVGHEMGHAFDNCGITYGKDGNKTELTKMVLRSYYERADCFVDQFDKYHGIKKVANETDWDCDSDEDDDKRTQGRQTANENIADTTGLQAVFGAYKKLSEKENPDGEKRLPGLEGFTDDQLFFLSFAAMWCQVQTPQDEAIEYLSRDSHSSAELRVIGAVSNTEDFAKAFDCPAGSPMNPRDKCSIWDKPGARMDLRHDRKQTYSRNK